MPSLIGKIRLKKEFNRTRVYIMFIFIYKRYGEDVAVINLMPKDCYFIYFRVTSSRRVNNNCPEAGQILFHA